MTEFEESPKQEQYDSALPLKVEDVSSGLKVEGTNPFDTNAPKEAAPERTKPKAMQPNNIEKVPASEKGKDGEWFNNPKSTSCLRDCY